MAIMSSLVILAHSSNSAYILEDVANQNILLSLYSSTVAHLTDLPRSPKYVLTIGSSGEENNLRRAVRSQVCGKRSLWENS